MQWYAYDPPPPWFGLDSDWLCKLHNAGFFTTHYKNRRTNRKFGAVPVESIDVVNAAEDKQSNSCWMTCAEQRARVKQPEVYERTDLLMVCPEKYVCVEVAKTATLERRRIMAPDELETTKGVCRHPDQNYRTEIKVASSDCADTAVLGGPSTVLALASTSSSNNRKRKRADIDVNLPAPEEPDRRRGDLQMSVELRPIYMSLADLNNQQRIQKQFGISTMTWTESHVQEGHRYRACIATAHKVDLDLSVTTIQRGEDQ